MHLIRHKTRWWIKLFSFSYISTVIDIRLHKNEGLCKVESLKNERIITGSPLKGLNEHWDSIKDGITLSSKSCSTVDEDREKWPMRTHLHTHLLVYVSNQCNVNEYFALKLKKKGFVQASGRSIMINHKSYKLGQCLKTTPVPGMRSLIHTHTHTLPHQSKQLIRALAAWLYIVYLIRNIHMLPLRQLNNWEKTPFTDEAQYSRICLSQQIFFIFFLFSYLMEKRV